MSESHKKQLVSGIFWFLTGQIGYLGVGLVANILLARLLTVYEFGQMGIVLFFILVASALTEAGLGGALVRNINTAKKDYSTIFLFNLAVSLLLMFIIIISAKHIAIYYDDLRLKNILIACSFVIVLNAFQFVQSAKLVKNMQFRQKATYDFIAIFIASVSAIILANKGMGVWALVIMHLLLSGLRSAMYWIFEGGIGQLVFDRASFKYHYKFGVNTTLASILNRIFDNVYQLILGKYFTINQTGLFYQAKNLQAAPIGAIEKVIQSVVFSSLSKLQENEEEFTKYYKKIVSIFTVVSGLICLLIFLYAENLLSFFYGEKWVEATFFMKVLILSSFFYLQENFNRVVFKVYNRTDVVLKLEIVKKCIQSLSILAGLWYLSLEVLIYGILATSIISYYINFAKSRKIFKSLGWYEIKVLCTVIILAILLGGITLFVSSNYGTLKTIPFYYVPVIIILFFLSVWAVGIFNPMENIRKLKKLIKD
ncbi:MAG: lipopolysaccharide biosynthesis protein [Bacteroidia bacterium]|nr:lipopolysaccharide biosynthesis protein [Bacteroidia bacterium]